MALRPIDNAIPMTPERPKKQAKIALPAQKVPDRVGKDENKLPSVQALPEDASIDYVLSENLQGFQDPDTKFQGLVGGLESKDWLKVCGSLNDARRFALHHPDYLEPILEKIILVMVKAIKNPRSALCKTSLMAAADVFKAFGEKLLEPESDSFNQLLLQMLLKASQDKKFVCEEADRALAAMVESIAPFSLLKNLAPYAAHLNLRVRAKAAMSISNCVSKMDLKGLEQFGLVELIKMAANLINDKLPEAREAARGIAISVYEARTENEEEKEQFWQAFCHSNLPATHALAMVKLVVSP